MCNLKSFRRLFKLSLQAIKEKFSADMIETRKRTASVCRLRDQELRQFQNNLKMISEHNSQVMYLLTLHVGGDHNNAFSSWKLR